VFAQTAWLSGVLSPTERLSEPERTLILAILATQPQPSRLVLATFCLRGTSIAFVLAERSQPSQAAGSPRADLEPTDTALVRLMIGAAIDATAESPPALRRRALGVLLDGLRAARDGCHRVPVAALAAPRSTPRSSSATEIPQLSASSQRAFGLFSVPLGIVGS